MLQWISKQSANTQSTTAGRQLFNRILLAKLKIIVASDGVAPLTKEIALWQPVKRSDLKLPAKDKEMFTLWEQKEDTSKRGVASELPQEKPFVVSLSDDHCPLYLVFSNCTVDSKECKRDGIQVFATDNPKGFSPCLAYVDDVGDADKIEIPLQIHVSVDKDNFKFSFVIKPNEDEVQEKLIKPNEEKKEENSKILTKINEREKLQEKKDKTTKEEKDRLAILNTEIGSHKKEDLEKKNKELENKIEQIKNVQKAASQAAYHIGTFSIYLLKSGSTKENALNSENQLLLLEVKEK
ncbi:MAG: hypothetical protein LBQ50_08005 [Planctomycetaceae bacterium]|nr:hypothetical protein [Planctomycetaceae bacterium]